MPGIVAAVGFEKMISAIIFDFDGPLFDGRKAVLSGLQKLWRDNPSVLTGAPPKELFCHLYNPERVLRIVLPPVPLDVFDGLLVQFETRLKEIEHNAQSLDGVSSLLHEARERGIKLAVLSKRECANLSAVLRIIGLFDYFDFVAGSNSTTSPKPSPIALNEVLARLSVKPSDAIFVGDSDVDWQCASAAKVTYYHCEYAGEPTRSAHRFAAASLKTVKDLFFILGGYASPQSLWTPGSMRIPLDLKEAVTRGRLRVLAGAGISIPSGYGSWNSEYRDLFEENDVSALLDHHDLPDALQLLAAKPGLAAKLHADFRTKFAARADRVPNYYHKVLVQMPCERIWTTNYDSLFEQAFAQAGHPVAIIKSNADFLSAPNHKRQLIKMNGDFELPLEKAVENLDWPVVVIQEHFDLFEQTRPDLWKAFEEDYRGQCLLIIGASLRDPVIKRILSRARKNSPKTNYAHYLVTTLASDPIARNEQMMIARALERQRIFTVFANTHSDIAEFCAELALIGLEPIVGFSGNFIPNSSSEALAADGFSAELGKLLAGQGYRVSSGAGPHVGIPAISSAAQVSRQKARFYLREKSTAPVPRTANSLIVEGESYSEMRKVFISEVSVLIVIGGVQHNEDTPGIITEISMALDIGAPVLLFPQFGGVVAVHYQDILQLIEKSYLAPKVLTSVREINAKIAALRIDELTDWARRDFHATIRAMLAECILSGRAKRSGGFAAWARRWGPS